MTDTTSFSCAEVADANTAGCTVHCSTNVSCPPSPQSHVGQNTTAVEQELERVIAELGLAMVRAHQAGDPSGARIYLDRQNAVKAQRSPEHLARLEQEDARRCDELTMAGLWTDSIGATK